MMTRQVRLGSVVEGVDQLVLKNEYNLGTKKF